MKRLAAAEEIMALVIKGMGLASGQEAYSLIRDIRRMEVATAEQILAASENASILLKCHHFRLLLAGKIQETSRPKEHPETLTLTRMVVMETRGGVKIGRNVKIVVKRDKRPKGERRGKSKKRLLFS
jgi:hypothetical protein